MRKWNKLLALLLAMVMALGLTTAGFAADAEDAGEPPAEAGEADYAGWDTIKVFETTDVHGFITDVSSGNEDTFQYRMAYIAKAVADARASEDYADVLLLDGGDIYQGTPHSNLTNGAAMRAALDAMGYDAVALGNHEFDWAVDTYAADAEGTVAPYEIGEFKGDPDIPVLMYNLYDDGTTNRAAFVQEYTVVEKAGYRIAILGYADDYSADIMTAKIAPYDIDEDLEKLSAKAAEVREAAEADVLVILAHADPEAIANAMDPEVVDLVAGGHTHRNVAGTAENGIAYIQCRNQARNYATAEIKINPETGEVAVVNPGYEEVYNRERVADLYLTEDNDKLDSDIVAISQAAWEAVKDGMDEVLLTVDQDVLKSPINENTTTSVAGNWLTGMMLEATADLDTIAAFTNGGGIRFDMVREEGADTRDIRVLDIYTQCPFDNHFLTYSITGAQLAAHLELALQGSYENSNYGDQFSGIVVTYNNVMENGEKVGIKVTSIVTDSGEEIDITDTETTYNVCVNEYNATLPGAVFEGMTPVVEPMLCPIDNQCFLEVLRARREANGLEWTLDTTVRAVEEDAGEPTEPAEPAEPAAPTFSDVTEANWHYEYVTAMAEAGIVSGNPGGSFKPNDTLTWGQALKMVLLNAGYEEQAPVEGGTWASGYIALAVSEGILEEAAEQNAVITRLEMCQLLAKTLKIDASEAESAFPDTDDGYVTALVELGVIDGIDGAFQPDSPLTRAQLCKILYLAPEAKPAYPWAEDLAEDDVVTELTAEAAIGPYMQYVDLFEERTFTNSDEEIGDMTYYVYDPTAHGFSADKTYPVVLWLHGSGNASLGNLAIIAAGAAGMASEEYQQDLGGMYIVCPLANEDGFGTWRPTGEKNYNASLKGILDEVKANYAVSDTVLLAGTSAGGVGVTLFAEEYHDILTGIFWMSTTLPSAETIQQYSDEGITMWFEVGRRDELGAFDNSFPEGDTSAYDGIANFEYTVFDWVRCGDKTIASFFSGVEMGQHCSCIQVNRNLIFDDGTPDDPNHPKGVTGWFASIVREAPGESDGVSEAA